MCSSASSSISSPSPPRPAGRVGERALASARARSSGSSGSSRNSVERLSKAEVNEKYGFSVVAPTRTSRPSSTCGSSASCWVLLNRCTSSRNRIVPWPCSPSRSLARSTTSRTSFTPALTALIGSNALSVAPAMSRAIVVLPVPGGPQRITEERRSPSISARSGRPGASRSRWPTTSSSVRGRSRAASGGFGGQPLLRRRRKEIRRHPLDPTPQAILASRVSPGSSPDAKTTEVRTSVGPSASARGRARRAARGRAAPGAPVSGSAPDCVFGKAMTSRMFSSPASSATSRSTPNAKPGVRRRAVAERVEQEPEARLRLLGLDAEQARRSAAARPASGSARCPSRAPTRSARGRTPASARRAGHRPTPSRAGRGPRDAAS